MYFKIAITSNGQADQLEVIVQEALLWRYLPCGSNFSPWMIVNAAEGQRRSMPAWQDADSRGRKGKGEKARGREKKTERQTRVPNHYCWGPAVYTISDRKGNVGGREGENERLEKGVQWGKERNSFWGDIWLWLRGAVWTSQPLPLVLTGPFGGSWCCLFLNSKWLVNWWTWAMDTMTEQRLGTLVALVFTCLCIYVQFVQYVMYLWEWVKTVWEAGIYTKHKFLLEMPNLWLCNALWCKDMSYIC